MSRNTILWIDAGQGGSGDMMLGALVDLGVPLDVIRGAVNALPIDGWQLEAHSMNRCGLAATKVDVQVDEHVHGRKWSDLESIVRGGTLEPRIAERSLAIFRRLIEAEAEVHGRSPEEVHLHEAGGTDAIVDVVGSVAGWYHLAPTETIVSPLTTGFGSIHCAHGDYPVPAPATALLLRGAPIQGGEIEAERLTPTGAAILTGLADRFGTLPAMRPQAVGNGAGTRDLGQCPNMLRLITGESDSPAPVGAVEVLECTLDDITSQALSHATERLFEAGAIEVFTSAVAMKKGRSGHLLTVLCLGDDVDRLAEVTFRHTTTLGIRRRRDARFELERDVETVETAYGPIRVKRGYWDGERVQCWPEYEDCAAAAVTHGVPLETVQRAALEAHE